MEPYPDAQCLACQQRVVPNESGNCDHCGESLPATEQQLSNLVQYYCIDCDDFFLSSNASEEQAVCTECGDLCNTVDFHSNQMEQENKAADASYSSTDVASNILIAFTVLGVLAKIIRMLFNI